MWRSNSSTPTPEMAQIEEVRSNMLIGYMVIAVWESYLCSRTIRQLRKMTAPPELFEGGMDGYTFQRIRKATQNEASNQLLEQFIDIGIKSFQITTDYFPYVWRLTANYSSSPIYRAVLFTAIDKLTIESAFIPVVFLTAVYQTHDPILAILSFIQTTLYSAAYLVLRTLLIIYLFELIHPPGIVVLIVLYDFAGLIFLAVFIRVLENHILRPLFNSAIGEKTISMATSVGYPKNKIYVDETIEEPETTYYSALWFNMITITPKLMSVLDPDQTASMVAHEIGRWYYSHNMYHHIFHYTYILAKCYALLVTYSNERVCRIFRVNPDAHPIISHILFFHFIWTPIKDFVKGNCGILKAYGYFIRDKYSCRAWNSKSLREALIKLSHFNLQYYPLFDGWHSAYVHGRPSTIQRISRILREDQRG